MKKSGLFSVLAALVCTLVCASAPASAGGEAGLYPAAPPPGSAFIRFLNANSPMAVAVNVRGKSYGAASMGNITAYAPVQQGEADLSVGGKTDKATLKEGVYYTVLYYKGDIKLLEEPTTDNRLKAQIVLINASSSPDVSLKTADGSTEIVNPVNTAKLDGRAVNPVKVPFSVYTGAKKIDDINAHLLERGERYAVVVYDGPNGKPAVSFN